MKFTVDFGKAFFILLRVFFPIWGGLVILISLIGVWMASLESLPISEGLYFAWVTATTVGYGDISPTSRLSQFVAILDAIVGIVLTGIIVSIALNAAKLSIQKNGSLDKLSDSTKQRMQQSAQDRQKNTKG